MDKTDLIYDVVCEIRDQNNKRFEKVEKDIQDLYKFKNTLLGYCGGITLAGSMLVEGIKSFLGK